MHVTFFIPFLQYCSTAILYPWTELFDVLTPKVVYVAIIVKLFHGCLFGGSVAAQLSLKFYRYILHNNYKIFMLFVSGGGVREQGRLDKERDRQRPISQKLNK